MLGKLEIDSQGTIIANAQATAGTSGIYAYDGIVIKNGNITAYAVILPFLITIPSYAYMPLVPAVACAFAIIVP